MRGSDYAELATFVAVAEERNFRRAAARLGVSHSAISHTIRELEERLETRLLNRTTRSVSVTEAGQSLLDRIRPAFAEIASAVQSVQAFRDRPAGTVRINLPRLAAEVVFTPRLREFASRYPDVRIDLSVEDGLTDIVAGGFDAGIRPGQLLQRDMIGVRVTRPLRGAVIGSPGYFATRPVPHVPNDLANHDCINYRWVGSGALYRWPFSKAGESLDVAVEGPLILNDTNLILDAALDGVGLAYTLESRVSEHIASGRLVRVLEDWCPPIPPFFLYYPGRRQTPPALAAVIEFFRVRD